MFIGIIPWFFIQDSITQGAKELRINRQFITKVKFPVSTILTYTEVSRLFVHLILMAFMYAYVLFHNQTELVQSAILPVLSVDVYLLPCAHMVNSPDVCVQ